MTTPAEPRAMTPRENPFRASRIEALAYRFLDDDLERLLARLPELGNRGALVGAKGSGKTTLMEALERRFREEGRPVLFFRRRPAEEPLPRLHDLGPENWVFLDGAEEVRFLERRRLLRDVCPAAGLVVTSHRPLRWIPTLHRHRTTPELLVELVHELLRHDDLSCPWSEEDLRRLYDQHHGDLRQVFRALYDLAPKTLGGSRR